MQSDTPNQINQNSMSLRIERVSTALYMVTNHLSDREPLKCKLRTLGYESIELAYNTNLLDQGQILQNLSVTASLLQIAAKAKLMSVENAEIIIREIGHIKDMIYPPSGLGGIGSIEASIKNLFADIPKFIPQVVHQNSALESRHTGTAIDSHHTFDTNYFPQLNSVIDQVTPAQSSVSVPHKQPIQVPTNNQITPSSGQRLNDAKAEAMRSSGQAGTSDQFKNIKNIKNQPMAQEAGLTDRQQGILKEIRAKGQLTIRDLVEKITGCSEKTIQRELLSLVERGVLKKEGERRWSKYSIR